MITFDFETRSYADLKKVGAWAYSLHPTTEVICCSWGIDREPIQSWWPMGAGGMLTRKGSHADDTIPGDLHVSLGSFFDHTIEAHYVGFERAIWENIMLPKYGWPLPENEQWRDTMAVACYYAMPAALDPLSRALGFGPKPSEGARLITKYSKLHLKTAKPEIPDDDFKKFVAYCEDDVAREQSVSDELGDLPERELPIFFLDQEINLRGLHLDLEGIACASKIVDQRSEILKQEFRNITDLNPTQTMKLIQWFAKRGLILDNMQVDYLGDLLEHPPLEGSPVGVLGQGDIRRALEIRLEINKASTKKLDAMARQCADGETRARYQCRYHGAFTGRWTGQGFQPLNLVRNDEDIDPNDLVRDIMYGDAAWLDCIYGDAMQAVSKASRHWIMAEPGNYLMSGDYSSIEAIIRAYISHEAWEMQAYQDGVPIYEYMADKIHKLPPGTVTKKTHPSERQDGKTGELAFGYQGALGAWLKFDNSGRHTNERIIEICRTWRSEHPATVALWGKLQRAAIDATRDGKIHKANEVEFELVDEWLTMVAPNGKRIWYRNPEIRLKRPRWCQPEIIEKCGKGTCGHSPQPSLSYMAQKEGQWKRVHTYGGKLMENYCQFLSREILVCALLRLKAAGYHVILSVYDEVIVEEKKGFGSLEEFTALMAGPLPNWCADWPVRVSSWEGERYRK